MIELTQDLWELEADATVITTNGAVRKDGHCVMGRGCAREARDRFRPMASSPIDRILGSVIKGKGNHVHDLGVWKDKSTEIPYRIVSFPVKHRWNEKADPDLIRRSAGELVKLMDRTGWEIVAIVRPGCGNGGLSWAKVKKILDPVFDDRFLVCDYGKDS